MALEGQHRGEVSPGAQPLGLLGGGAGVSPPKSVDQRRVKTDSADRLNQDLNSAARPINSKRNATRRKSKKTAAELELERDFFRWTVTAMAV